MIRRRHGFPAVVRFPQQRTKVHVLVRDGAPCDDLIDVTIPARRIGMRDYRRRPTRAIITGTGLV